MDQKYIIVSPLMSANSLHSLTDGSDTICEDEEIREVKILLQKGNRATEKSHFDKAIKYYNSAIEIDSQNLDVLKSQALVNLKQQKIEEAAKIAETILAIDSKTYHGHLIKGLVYEHKTMYRSSLDILLTALNLDPKAADILTNHIAKVVSKFCQVSFDLTHTFQAMDTYEKLSFIGDILLQHQKHEACIAVLDSAIGKFHTNKKRVVMQSLITHATAHAQLLQTEAAIESFQKCLTQALSVNDKEYQTKSLANIAVLYFDSKEMYQAIIFYEKLLHLEAELLAQMGSENEIPEFWSKDLQCSINLNLSIAYKTIGNFTDAVSHAKKCLDLSRRFGLEATFIAECHQNLGMLLEHQGNYDEALQCYHDYMFLAEQSANNKNIGQAYGCLAHVYAASGKWSLALPFHDWSIAMATTSGDKIMLASAHENKGDGLCLKEDYLLALDCYKKMQSLYCNYDDIGYLTSFLKMAKVYRKLGQKQSSLYYLKETMSFAEKFGLGEIGTIAEFYAACINKDSSQFTEREEAYKSFLKLIPVFESNVVQEKLMDNLQRVGKNEHLLVKCYDGIQTVLSLVPDKLECLQYAEAKCRHRIMSLLDLSSSTAATKFGVDFCQELLKPECIKRIVSDLNSPILYYSVLESMLLLWVLLPADGIAHFSVSKSSKDKTFSEQISDLLSEVRKDCNVLELINTAEARALPCREQTKNSGSLCTSSNKYKIRNAETDQGENNNPLQLMYDMLVAPAHELLEKLEKGSHLIIVPDKELSLCPFGALLDKTNTALSTRFRISYIPCLMLLDKIMKNEKMLKISEVDLETQRQQARNDRLPEKINELSKSLPGTLTSQNKQSMPGKLTFNLREVSNPRLASSRTSTANGETHRTLKSDASFNSVNEIKYQDTLQNKSKNKKMMTNSTQIEDFEKILSKHTYSTLTTHTWTGTDITSSSQVVTHYQQINDQRTLLVFGCPKIDKMLMIHGKEWMPKSELVQAQKELILVADCLSTNPIMGEQATKQKLMKRIEAAEVIHIATWACLQEGFLLVTPESLTDQFKDSSHLLSIRDIANLNLKAKLIVLSTSGLTPVRDQQNSSMMLATSFLSAGAVCIVVCTWPVPDDTLQKFMFNFYVTLRNGELISEALNQGIQSIQNDERLSHVHYWATFRMIGKDILVNTNSIRHAQLDQTIAQCHVIADSQSHKPFLNPKVTDQQIADKEQNMNTLQNHIRTLLFHHYRNPHVIPMINELLNSSMTRLHEGVDNDHPDVLSEIIDGNKNALDLLHWLGFHFQARGTHLRHQYIIFPHWDMDGMLGPAHDALTAAIELIPSPACVNALCDALPLEQRMLSCLIDLISITKHAPEIQFRLIDVSVQPLWHCTTAKTLLSALGFHQIGALLTFNMIPFHKQLLTSMLKVLLSFSCSRSQILLSKLDVSQLGQEEDSDQKIETNIRHLPSLKPIFLQRNQLRMSAPWVSVTEHVDEMHEKMMLAKSFSDLNNEFVRHQQHARHWHHMSTIAKANKILDKYGRPSSEFKSKVKVKPGSTLSQDRIPVNQKKLLTTEEIQKRRNHAHLILQERLQDVENRKRNDIAKLYLPYIKL